MPIEVGQKLPEANFIELGAEGPAPVSVADVTAGKKIALFAVPGAFTPTCHTKHVPSFVGAAEDLAGKGVDEIVCVSVNDPFVMKAWGEATGASAAGIRMLADPESAFTKAIGLDIDLSVAGLGLRTKRFSMIVDDGTVASLNIEDNPGQAVESGAARILEQL